MAAWARPGAGPPGLAVIPTQPLQLRALSRAGWDAPSRPIYTCLFLCQLQPSPFQGFSLSPHPLGGSWKGPSHPPPSRCLIVVRTPSPIPKGMLPSHGSGWASPSREAPLPSQHLTQIRFRWRRKRGRARPAAGRGGAAGGGGGGRMRGGRERCPKLPVGIGEGRRDAQRAAGTAHGARRCQGRAGRLPAGLFQAGACPAGQGPARSGSSPTYIHIFGNFPLCHANSFAQTFH